MLYIIVITYIVLTLNNKRNKDILKFDIYVPLLGTDLFLKW